MEGQARRDLPEDMGSRELQGVMEQPAVTEAAATRQGELAGAGAQAALVEVQEQEVMAERDPAAETAGPVVPGALVVYSDCRPMNA